MVAACSSSVPRTLTKILAWRRSPLTSTCVTLAKPTRGSLTRVRSKSLSSIAINSPSFSCLCGFGMHLFPSACKIGRNCGAFAPYFFCFLACSLQSITQNSIEHRIGCNCGAFAPYFFYFSLAAPLSGKAPQGGTKEIWCNCGAFAPYFFQVRFLLCRICQIGCRCGAFAPYFFQVRFLLLDAHWGGSCTFFILIIPAQALGR